MSLVRTQARAGAGYDVIEIHEPLAGAYCWLRRHGADLPPAVVFSYGLEERGRVAEIAYRRQKGLPLSLKRRYSPLTLVLQAAYAVRHADHVICSNRADVDYLLRAGVGAHRLTQHHSGVEQEFLSAGQSRPWDAAPPPGILFLGSWLLRKGILDLAPAVTQVLRRRPTVFFTAAGCGVDASEVLRVFPDEVRSRVRVIPCLADNRALVNVYRQHTFFVLPSYYEGQPLAMIEAAALGLAIVTTGVCGMLDFIQNGCNGLTVPVGDSSSLASALEALIGDPPRARRLGEAARRTAQACTWSSAAAKIATAYEAAADLRGKRPLRQNSGVTG